jgi:hypothetical protein
MPIQNYGAIMQGAADLTAMPANAFAQGQQRKQSQDYRNSLLGMDQQRLSMDQDRFAYGQQQDAAKAQQADEDDAEWDAAYAKRDWASMARIDPQAAKVIYEHENKAQQAPYSLQTQQGPFGSQIIHDGQRFQVVEPPKPATPNQAEAPASQREYEWFSKLPEDQKAAYLNMKRSSATPEAAANIATAKTTATEKAKAAVAAQGDLPRVEDNASDMRNVLKQLKTHKGTRFIVGGYSIAPPVPGTPQADAYALWEQVQGKAFLEAFNSLKGGGQITEKEGEKATAAITRLSNRRQSLDSFQKAIKDLEDVVSAGESRARAKAGQGGTKRLKFDQNGDPVQ